MKIVGESLPRVDAEAKASGKIKYTDDLAFSGLFSSIVRSTIAYGEIVKIYYDEDFDFSEFTIVNYRDIEGENSNPIIFDDQPFLAEKFVRFIGEPILLLAHKSKVSLLEAQQHIKIEYKESEPLFDMRDSLKRKKVIYKTDNIFKNIYVKKGEFSSNSSYQTITRSYKTAHQEQLYLEPQSMLARYRENGIKIIGSMQCPFYIEEALEHLCGEKIEIEQAPTGGAFGGKEDYPSLMAAYVYLLCKKSKQDVKMVLSRSEDIAFTTKRHPSEIQLTSHFDKSGKLSSLKAEILIDGGAYATLSPVVLARTVLHVAGFYEIKHIEVDGYAVATNTPPNGAFRGFGAPQALFAIERHIDDIANHLSISPAKVREINLANKESKTLTGAKIKEYKNLRNIFEFARKESSFDKKINKKEPYKGIGMALFMHGGGFVGLGEEFLASKVILELNKDGVVEIKIGSTEMGQGAMTVLPQIVADTLDVDLSLVKYIMPNTKKVINSGPTVSSRTVMVVGGLLKEAAKKLREALGEYETMTEYKELLSNYLHANKERCFYAEYKKPKNIVWDEDRFYGNGYSAYSLGCYVAEVVVDRVDFRVSVTNFYAINDVGKVVNPILSEGQVEGGVTQGIGYALYEDIKYKNGQVQKPHISNYIVPMAADLEKITIEFLNQDEFSKGLGELPLDGVAPAIINGVVQALSIDIDAIPLTPERLEKLCR